MSPRRRTITVGLLYRDGHFVERGKLTNLKCLTVLWRGQTNWCDPWQFKDEGELERAVRVRLRLAGLVAHRWRIGESATDYAPIRCEVERLCRDHLSPRHLRALAVNAQRQAYAFMAAEIAAEKITQLHGHI